MTVKAIALVLVLLAAFFTPAAHAFAGNPVIAPKAIEGNPPSEEPISDFETAEAVLQAALLAATDDKEKQVLLLKGLAELYHGREMVKQEEDVLRKLIPTMQSMEDRSLLDEAVAYLRLSCACYSQNKFVDAETSARAAVDLLLPGSGPLSLNLAFAYNNLASIEVALKKYAAAQDHLLHSLAITERKVGKSHFLCGLILQNLASLYMTEGEPGLALRSYERSYQILVKKLPKDDSVLAELKKKARQAKLHASMPNKHLVDSKSNSH